MFLSPPPLGPDVIAQGALTYRRGVWCAEGEPIAALSSAGGLRALEVWTSCAPVGLALLETWLRLSVHAVRELRVDT